MAGYMTDPTLYFLVNPELLNLHPSDNSMHIFMCATIPIQQTQYKSPHMQFAEGGSQSGGFARSFHAEHFDFALTVAAENIETPYEGILSPSIIKSTWIVTAEVIEYECPSAGNLRAKQSRKIILWHIIFFPGVQIFPRGTSSNATKHLSLSLFLSFSLSVFLSLSLSVVIAFGLFVRSE